MITKRGHHHVLPPVIVQIAESCTASRRRGRGARISALEPTIVIHREHGQLQVVKRGIDLLDVVQDMTLRDKKLVPAIVVKILQPNAPARASTGQDAHPGRETSITERTVALVVVDTINLSRKLCHDDVWAPVIVIILKNNSHARQSTTVFR